MLMASRARRSSGGSSAKRNRRKRPGDDRSALGIDMPPPDDPHPSSPLGDQVSDSFILTPPDGGNPKISVSGQALGRCKVREIGRGRYGTVDIMKEPGTGLHMAVKRIRETQESQDYRYILREVKACLRAGECPFLVMCYGIMRLEGDIWICMELMDTSLDKFYRTAFDSQLAIPEVLLARVAHSALSGLHFMVKDLHLMHRDVKPSNMLVNRAGLIKLCDYGISGALESQPMSKTIQAGCKPYMAPERVDFEHWAYQQYDERSDVWSLGISLIEISTGSHPYDKWKSPFEQLKQVVHQPPPIDKLPAGPEFSARVREFATTCLTKDYDSRPRYDTMMQTELITWYLAESARKDVPSVDDRVGCFVSQVLQVQSANEDLVLNRQLTGALKLSDKCR